MTAVLESELLKLRTTRTALGFASFGVLLVLLVVVAGTLGGHPHTIPDKRAILSVGDALAPLLLMFGVVGATSEYRHRTVAAGALIVPSRLRLSAGRMIAYGLAGLAVGALMLCVSFIVGLPLLNGESGPSLGGGDYARAVAGTLISCGLAAMLGVAVGVLIANQVPAVITTLVFVFVAEPLIGQLSQNVHKFLPARALGAVAGANNHHQLAFGGAVAMIVLWTAVALTSAALIDRRRDIA
jgi:ABC-2 type transport system permease protein